MDLESDNFLNELLVQKKQKNFFNKCLSEGIDQNSIENLIKNLDVYKHLMKSNKIFLNDYISRKNIKSYFKIFEELNDNVEKIIINNKAKKLLSSVTSQRHSFLINEETHEIFRELVKQNISRNQLEEAVTFKLEAFSDSETFNKTLEQSLLKRISKENLKKKAESVSAVELGEVDNKIFFLINDANQMKELGTDMWCVSRDESMYNNYIKHGEQFVITFDYEKGVLDSQSHTATIVSPNGKVLENYDSKDKLFSDQELIKTIESFPLKKHPKEIIEFFFDKTEDSENSKKYAIRKSIAALTLSGNQDYLKEDPIFNDYFSFNEIENISLSAISDAITQDNAFSYVDKLNDLSESDKEIIVHRFFSDSFFSKDLDYSNEIEVFSRMMKNKGLKSVIESEISKIATPEKEFFYNRYGVMLSTMNEYDNLSNFTEEEIQEVTKIADLNMTKEEQFTALIEVTPHESIDFKKDLSYMINEDKETYRKVLNEPSNYEDVYTLFLKIIEDNNNETLSEYMIKYLNNDTVIEMSENLQENIFKNMFSRQMIFDDYYSKAKKELGILEKITTLKSLEISDTNVICSDVKMTLLNNKSNSVYSKYKENNVMIVEDEIRGNFSNEIYKTFVDMSKEMEIIQRKRKKEYSEKEKNDIGLKLKKVYNSLSESQKEDFNFAIEHSSARLSKIYNEAKKLKIVNKFKP
ncbi:MAG: hypothetical protein CL760_10420 [Chloroflexi bacterium]|nr:hypothetical protein [Chloroflexota bacterium]|tara:strand:+ start:19087 stop:21171 length:2085 start_codon:yes stop_codon:yes gene_type:complete